MQKIIPHIWYDKEAVEAANFYASVFPNSKVENVSKITDTPSGDCDIVSFTIMGYSFMSISAGPLFKTNPSISFMVNFDPAQDKEAKTRIDAIWKKLESGGKALMPLQKYPFAEKYGWIQDKFGVSWQLMLTDPKGEKRPPIIPSLMFKGETYGKCEEATNYYMSVFKNSRRGTIAKYPKGMEPDKEGAIMFTDFTLENQWFASMESAHKHDFSFNEAISLIVKCKDQKEIDYMWSKLSHYPESEQCGWCKDKYGVVWQITPIEMDEMLEKGTQEQKDRVTQAFLQMKKFDVAKLKKAYKG